MIEALAEAAGRPVSRETLGRLELYTEALRSENDRQNLVARSTLDQVWQRHIFDSAQLARFEPRTGASWLDVGSGAGLPGIVIACLVQGPVTLVEPRKLRAEFLRRMVEDLDLNAEVICSKIERVERQFDTITGRAVASLDRFLSLSQHLSTRNTVLALPKGRNAESELAEAKRTWQGVFHVERSITDPESAIIVAQGVERKRR